MFEPPTGGSSGETVLEPAVARVTRRVLTDVVETGTAARLRGAFTDSTGAPVWLGGKTGTGDNRFQTYGRGRRLIGSRSVSRTATFTFCLGDRFYGVITSAVLGPEAARYRFTSALPLAVMRILAPSFEHELKPRGAPDGVQLMTAPLKPAAPNTLVAPQTLTATPRRNTIPNAAPPTPERAQPKTAPPSRIPRENTDRPDGPQPPSSPGRWI